jgi:pyrroline-5-carboxylate reductase
MKNVGFIGYGHMGSVLLNALLETKAILPSEIYITNRTTVKLLPLKQKYPDITICEESRQVASQCDTLFLCVSTMQVHPVLYDIFPTLKPETHLILISGGLEISSVESCYAGPITKIIPTILAEVHCGTTLICHNQKVPEQNRTHFNSILGRIGKIMEIDEAQFEIAADFTSCAPGLIAAIANNFILAGSSLGNISKHDAQDLFLESIYGTAKTLREHEISLEEYIQRIATKGGATEGGVSVLNEQLPETFAAMFSVADQRHEQRKQITRQQFSKG